jgi:hypothetical protein
MFMLDGRSDLCEHRSVSALVRGPRDARTPSKIILG